MYFVKKKNIYKNDLDNPQNNVCVSYKSPYLCFATSSSAYTTTKSAKNTYAGGKKTHSDPTKFEDNTVKRGSGGNSYAGYLARKVGHKCTTNCDTKLKINKLNTYLYLLYYVFTTSTTPHTKTRL